MAYPDVEWCLTSVRGLTPERATLLLDRAAELGLLDAHGGGYYGIHPALPWYFRDLFERSYPAEAADRARRAFVEAMGILGNEYLRQFEHGESQFMFFLMAEEDNLLAAWRLAREHGWGGGVTSAMQGLRRLYEYTGRHAAWRLLVKTTVPDFIDPATDGPLPGREEDWSLVTGYRVHLALKERDWAEAERLERPRVDWNRKRTRSALETEPEARTDIQRNTIRTFATVIEELAYVQFQNGDPACASTYREAFDLYNAIDDTAAQSICAFNLSRAYVWGTHLRDLDEAERWARKSFDLRPLDDPIGRSDMLSQLGLVFFQRFLDARAANRPVEQLASFFADAGKAYEQALETLPEGAITHRKYIHDALGDLYLSISDFDYALQHYRQASRYHERANDQFDTAVSRYKAAGALVGAGQLDDARSYADAALANYQTLGDRAAAEIQKTQRLIAEIDKAIAEQQGKA
jgi:tetratricopeptide (TPR) repeat protein